MFHEETHQTTMMHDATLMGPYIFISGTGIYMEVNII